MIDFNNGYNYLNIESFRFSMRADFFSFDIDGNLVDALKNDLLTKNIENDDWNSYNLFSYKEKSIEDFKRVLLDNLFSFCDQADINVPKEIYALGWLNILEPKDIIKTHFHSLEKENFFSCNVSLDNYNSTTTFHLPWIDRYGDEVEILNTKGKSCIFPSWMWHGVYNVTEKRYSLGIDFYTKERLDDYFNREHETNPAPIQHAVQIFKSNG